MSNLKVLFSYGLLMLSSWAAGSGDRTGWKVSKILSGHIVSKGGIGEDWTHKVKLDEVNDVKVRWKNSRDENGQLWIIMQVSANTKGYVGVGFSPVGSMAGADMAIGWVDDDGNSHLHDFYGISNGIPVLDKHQDYVLLSGVEEDGTTIITFKRKWENCDEEEDLPLHKDTTRLIWAVGKEDLKIDGDKPSNLRYHGINRGVQSVFLYDDAKAHNFPKPGSKDIKTWDMRMNNVEISNENTTYHCRVEKFQDVGKKHHLIGWEPLIEPENIRNVHHIIMYECHIPQSLVSQFDHYASTNHKGGDCYTKNMPSIWGQSCTGFLLVWTVGSEGDMLPTHVGAPLGQDHGGATYFLIEMHYENPEGKRIIDNSGIRVYYTDKLRQNEGGVAYVGYRHSPFQLIPPRQKDFMISGLCTKECLEKVLPKTGINVVTTFIHAHLFATKLRLRHIRNGIELPLISEENHYDFNYQQSRNLKNEIKIMPGDELITECQYNTEDTDNPVLGGLATDQEMCQTFLFYYPKIEIGMCTSQSEFSDFMHGLGIHGNVSGEILKEINMPYVPKGEYDPSDTAKEIENYGKGLSYNGLFEYISADDEGITVSEHIKRMNWQDPKVAMEVQDKWKNGKHYQFCTAEGSRRIKLNNHIVNYPVINKPLDKSNDKKRTCDGASNTERVYASSFAIATSLSLIFLNTLVALRLDNY